MHLDYSTHLCTLFEGDYQFGLGALLNSLHKSGFVGTMWIGYRGHIPVWAKPHTDNHIEHVWWIDGKIRTVFLALDTKEHLTYVKPDFMLHLWEKHCTEAQNLIYFDPDIIVKTKWSFFEDWVKNGIALCEDVSSPLSQSHPLRKSWASYFLKLGINLKSRDNIYVNGGFIGVSFKHLSFLKTWKEIQDTIRADIPFVNHLGVLDRSFLFCKTDQDALNIAKDMNTWNMSIADKNAMDFAPGGHIMAHAIGSPKPWNNNFIIHLMKTGNRPSPAERLFFDFVHWPIDLFARQRAKLYLKKINLLLAILLGRLIGN